MTTESGPTQLTPRFELIAWCFCGVLLGLGLHSPGTRCSPVATVLFAVGSSFLLNERRATNYYGPFAAGLIASLLMFSWMPESIEYFTGWPIVSSAALAFGVVMVATVRFFITHLVYRALTRSRLHKLEIAYPSAWLVGELFTPELVPWTLGQLLLPLPLLAQVSDLFGSSLLSFLLLYWAGALVRNTCLLFGRTGGRNMGKRIRQRELTLGILWPVLTFAGVIVYGLFRTQQVQFAIDAAPQVEVSMVQANLDPKNDFTSAKIESNVERHRVLLTANSKTPDFIVWPESAVGRNFGEGLSSLPPGQDPLPDVDIPLIFGGQTPVYSPTNVPTYYNTAFLRLPSGALQRYHKQILVPFTEFTPFPILFGIFEPKGGRVSQYVSGSDQAPLEIPIKGKSGTKVKVGTAICYEDMWPNVFRALVADSGAQMLLVLTDDAWFGKSVAAEQHLFNSQMRAIENRRYFLRSSNDGVTAIVDPFGAVVERLPRGTAAELRTDAPHVLNVWSLFQAVGSMPLQIFAGFVVILALSHMRIRN